MSTRRTNTAVPLVDSFLKVARMVKLTVPRIPQSIRAVVNHEMNVMGR